MCCRLGDRDLLPVIGIVDPRDHGARLDLLPFVEGSSTMWDCTVLKLSTL